ncbi:nitrate reductase NapE component [Labrenzia sp. EL_195]|nr:nitrate reductase NapE component [Labrenzia sp. EL_195]
MPKEKEDAKDTEDDQSIEYLQSAKTINDMSSKGWLSDLLGPMAKVLGKELGEWAESVVKGRRENVEHILEEVYNKNPEARVPETPRAALDFQEWLKGASTAEPNTPEASIWQSIIEDIINADDEVDGNIIATAQSLRKSDLLIMERIDKRFEVSLYDAERISQKNLAVIENNYLAFSIFILLCLGVVGPSLGFMSYMLPLMIVTFPIAIMISIVAYFYTRRDASAPIENLRLPARDIAQPVKRIFLTESGKEILRRARLHSKEIN